ncbi:MAG: type II toxin-antitoxin system RelE/ParE family toxin [Candidatus Sungbacteria bacterium]|uniref:Type II toxin-antitoxin system RelE/ParE family toxin n=1 Tax=Candidatus Sungiibacteriota bacterium TaxID=2750080 RepID=A0A932YWK1_9BACT|nr:type II toxin-antitoxin system RelE/ParE family toxin [Candidatus Sungbacteria bacterium]
MRYAVKYDTRVPGDLQSIDVPSGKRIRNAIEAKLTAQPELFGKPLRHSLAGFRVLRVGMYRVVYLIEQSVVLVLLIGDRKHVYQEAFKRLG